MRLRLLPYDNASQSCGMLYSTLNSYISQSRTLSSVIQPVTREGHRLYVLRLRGSNTTFQTRPSDFIINWGRSSDQANFSNGTVVNKFDAVNTAANKRNFFRHIEAYNRDTEDPANVVHIPEFTTEHDQVRMWLQNGKTAFARTELRGNSGRGIVDVIDEAVLDTVPAGTLFTKYIPKKYEFRVHVVDGRVIALHRKAMRVNRDEDLPIGYQPNWRIRSYNNGFIFERNIPFEVPAIVGEQAVAAVKAAGLDFGGVDVIYNQMRNKAYVIEINTAPGIEGETLYQYAEAFTRYLEARV